MAILAQFESADVCLAITAKTKDALLEVLAGEAAARLERSSDEILKALQSREALGSTALGHGAAMPHAQLAGTSPPFVLFARLAKPVQFEARDGEPVDLVFLVLWPAAATKELLTAMAEIARVLQDQNLRRGLRGADTADEIVDLLRQGASADK
jgi:PTS system nitrogen regulatory IIA component